MNENLFEELGELGEDYDENEYEQKINSYLDKRAGDWNFKIVVQLFDLARKSTNDNKKKRPIMIEIRELFNQIILKDAN